MLKRSLDWRSRNGPVDAELADSWNNYGLLLSDLDRLDEAEAALRHSDELYMQVSGDDDTRRSSPLHNLAIVLRKQDRLEEARATATLALRLKREGNVQIASQALTQGVLAGIERRMGLLDDALRNAQESVDLRRTTYGNDSPMISTGLTNLAHIHQQRGEIELARSLFREAVALHQKGDHDDTMLAARARLAYGHFLLETGELRPRRASSLNKRARPPRNSCPPAARCWRTTTRHWRKPGMRRRSKAVADAVNGMRVPAAPIEAAASEAIARPLLTCPDQRQEVLMTRFPAHPSTARVGLGLISLFVLSSTTALAQHTVKPVLHGEHWMAITGKPLAATAGALTFARGGNAVDAACAMLAATATMWDTLGWGGETQALIYNPHTGEVKGINALGVAPTGATPEFFHSKGMVYPPEYGPLAAVTPGTPGGLMVMLAEYGKLSLADVLAPAMQMAKGYPIEKSQADNMESRRELLATWPGSKKVFLPHFDANDKSKRAAPVGR